MYGGRSYFLQIIEVYHRYGTANAGKSIYCDEAFAELMKITAERLNLQVIRHTRSLDLLSPSLLPVKLNILPFSLSHSHSFLVPLCHMC